MSLEHPSQTNAPAATGTRIAVVAARFNASIVQELLAGCLARLAERKVNASAVRVHHVPGAFELPVTAELLAREGTWDAVICLGCVIKGQTPHFEHVAGQAASGIRQVSVKHGLPVIFGVLTTLNRKQALDRCGGSHGHAGISAADAAVEMSLLARSIRGDRSTGVRTTGNRSTVAKATGGKPAAGKVLGSGAAAASAGRVGRRRRGA